MSKFEEIKNLIDDKTEELLYMRKNDFNERYKNQYFIKTIEEIEIVVDEVENITKKNYLNGRVDNYVDLVYSKNSFFNKDKKVVLTPEQQKDINEMARKVFMSCKNK